MSHMLAIHSRKPNAAQKARLKKSLSEIDKHLSLCVGSQPGEQAMYVEAPDEYGASHMTEKAQAVRALVAEVMG